MRAEYREEPCKSALNPVHGMGFEWSLNPYMGCAHRCAFCYVRFFEHRADRPSDDRYGGSVRVKINVHEVLARELARKSWKKNFVAVGAATDPYQPAEGKYRLTRRCIEAFAHASNPFGIITRGPLIVRDIDVLTDAARRAQVGVHFSVPTVDEKVWAATEPGTAPPRARLRALSKLIDAGIEAGVGMAPILPGISDRPEQLEDVVRAARDAGATRIWAHFLYLKPGTREHFMETLERHWPQERERYEKMYGNGRAYLPKSEGAALSEQIAALKKRYAVRDRRVIKLVPPEPTEQLELAI